MCSGVIDCVAGTLSRLVENAALSERFGGFIMTGGVMANAAVRSHIEASCAARVTFHCCATFSAVRPMP